MLFHPTLKVTPTLSHSPSLVTQLFGRQSMTQAFEIKTYFLIILILKIQHYFSLILYKNIVLHVTTARAFFSADLGWKLITFSDIY